MGKLFPVQRVAGPPILLVRRVPFQFGFLRRGGLRMGGSLLGFSDGW
ncbi:MAG: hypothetical protein AAGD22_08795 [Verrucomicrobiota bacterium]